MKFIIAKKKSMTQLWSDDGQVIPVTVVAALPNVVTGVRTKDKDGYTAVLVGAGARQTKRVAKPQQGQWKDLGSFALVREFRTADAGDLARGSKLDVSMFQPGDVIQVTGTSKGRGFAGVVKRHHFKGGPASHGHKDNLRAPGSIGATFPQHVLKGTRMAGRMGNAQVTVKNLKVVQVHPETNELLVTGAVPGARNGYLFIVAP